MSYYASLSEIAGPPGMRNGSTAASMPWVTVSLELGWD